MRNPERPSYIHCVAHTHIDLLKKSWCGRDIENEFHFTGADHAAENGRQRGRLVACRQCTDAIILALENGYALGGNDWQPIITAPVDGTEILVRTDDGICLVAYYRAENHPEIKTLSVCNADAGWCQCSNGGFDLFDSFAVQYVEPKEWKPI